MTVKLTPKVQGTINCLKVKSLVPMKEKLAAAVKRKWCHSAKYMKKRGIMQATAAGATFRPPLQLKTNEYL